MGKNKSKKNNNVFKVAGAKSLKSKVKAKSVGGQLKNIKLINKSKTIEVDQQLVSIQDKVRQSKPQKNTSVNPTISNSTKTDEDFKKSQENSKQILQDLDAIQL